jgi:hypothetical protein
MKNNLPSVFALIAMALLLITMPLGLHSQDMSHISDQLWNIKHAINEASLHASYEASQASKAQAESKKAADNESAKHGSDLQYLKKYLPTLQASNLDRISADDLHKLYYKAYREQGMSMADAREKAGL